MSDCPVCYRYVTASRETIRKIVIGEHARLGYVGIAKIKQRLCTKCKHIGYSAQGHTVGEAGIPLDATEAGTAASSVPLPTFSIVWTARTSILDLGELLPDDIGS